METSETLSMGFIIAVVAGLFAVAAGWVMNILAIVSAATSENLEISTIFIARCIGVLFLPI